MVDTDEAAVQPLDTAADSTTGSAGDSATGTAGDGAVDGAVGSAPGRELPVGRYSAPRPRGRRRWIYWSVLSAFVVAGVVVAYVGYENLGATPIDPEVTTYQIVDAHTAAASFTVTRNHPDEAADCIVYALAADGSEVGRREVYVPPGGSTVDMNTRFQTYELATTVEFYGCSYQVPAYLTKSMPPSG